MIARVTLVRIFIFLFLSLSLVSKLGNAQNINIVAKVNNHAITSKELADHIKFYKLISKNITQNPNYKTLILNKIIDKTIILDKSKKIGINIDNAEIENRIDSFRVNNKKLYNTIKKYKNNNLQKILISEIEKNLSWSKIISELTKKEVRNINDGLILEALEEMDLKKSEYKINLIQIAVNKSDENFIVINKIYKELEQKKFLSDEGQYSQYSGIVNIIDLGWISKSQINKNIFLELIKYKPRKYSLPIDSGDFYVIFAIKDIKMNNFISDGNYKKAFNKIEKDLIKNSSEKLIEEIRSTYYIETYS
jgi:parvulin-like peptidyl-prolyl isomerase